MWWRVPEVDKRPQEQCRIRVLFQGRSVITGPRWRGGRQMLRVKREWLQPQNHFTISLAQSGVCSKVITAGLTLAFQGLLTRLALSCQLTMWILGEFPWPNWKRVAQCLCSQCRFCLHRTKIKIRGNSPSLPACRAGIWASPALTLENYGTGSPESPPCRHRPSDFSASIMTWARSL